MHLWKRLPSAALVWTSLVIVAVAFLGYHAATGWRESYASFDPDDWRARIGEQRRPLAEGFLKEYPVSQLSQERVIALLGKPDSDRGNWTYHLEYQGRDRSSVAGNLQLTFDADAVNSAYVDPDPLPVPGLPFTRERWATPALRVQAAGDLARRQTPMGRSRSAVRALLGPPDEQDRELIYDLGKDDLGMDGVWLSIALDEKGHPIEGHIVYG